ncbi:fructose PTS transporter subunit IIA [Photobacterium sp. SDRW27]|uniref:PTS sugar transporter subunit IIA n=1 Tax=Photobacterium obscurum TaxID=2829490 RepID=UPI002244B063|nr:fructose PTS transporter subunit IIA [Photobacterium obscurum]MCW8329215.1 fructose PTS transporter subunit IIA [Photobacterium obscurum]
MKAVFKPEHILIDAESKTKEQAFAFIAAQAQALGYVTDAKAYEEGLVAREKQSSTGFTGGVAIPHCKNEVAEYAGLFVVRFSHSIEWETMDEQPVDTAVALSIPADGDESNIRILTKLSRCMMRKPFRETLQQGDASQVQDVIATAIA